MNAHAPTAKRCATCGLVRPAAEYNCPKCNDPEHYPEEREAAK